MVIQMEIYKHSTHSAYLSFKALLLCLPPQVRKGAIGAKCGLVFAYNDSEPFDADKHFKRFKKFDSWDYKDYKEFVQDRYVTFLVCNMLSC